MFQLDDAFAATSQPIAELPLSQARLQSDARFPWIVLIPRKPAARELEDLSAGQRSLLMEEIVRAGQAVRAVGAALGRPVAKLNVGQLGNLTPQLHVHVVGRRPDDAAWPGPVWGLGRPAPFTDQALHGALDAARRALGA